MPEVDFQIRWPDGTRQQCVSPSRTIEAALTAGASYPVDEFVRRSTGALAQGSERVRAKYGFACTAAAAQAEELAREAQRFAGEAGVVHVELMGRRDATPAPSAPPLSGHLPVVIVGGGQAGLSASWYLKRDGIEHVVLERSTATHAWRDERWDAFCLVTPNWQCQLPGYPYPGDDPDGFMVRAEILDYLEGFRRSFDPPLAEGITVTAVQRPGEQRCPRNGQAGVRSRQDSRGPFR